MDAQSDEALARAVREGSLPAFEVLVRRYQGRVHRFLLRLCGNASDAQEVTQDAFVRAYEAIGQFDPRRPFAPWLFTIARRRCIDHHRTLPPTPADAPLLPEPLDEEDPSKQLSRREDDQQLWTLARNCLAPLQFQALWLRYADDFSVAETAQVLGKTQTHVKVLLFRARQILVAESGRADAPPDRKSRLAPNPSPFRVDPHRYRAHP